MYLYNQKEFCHSKKIHVHSIKIYLCLKNFHIQPFFFFHIKNISLFNQKKNFSMKSFYTMNFGSLVNLVLYLLVKQRTTLAWSVFCL